MYTHRIAEELFYTFLETSWGPLYNYMSQLKDGMKERCRSLGFQSSVNASEMGRHLFVYLRDHPILRSQGLEEQGFNRLRWSNRICSCQVPERIYNLPNISCKNALCVSGSRRCFQICGANLLRHEGKTSPKRPITDWIWGDLAPATYFKMRACDMCRWSRCTLQHTSIPLNPII